MSAMAIFAVVACGGDDDDSNTGSAPTAEVVQVEVTREVPVEVTVEVTKNVQSTVVVTATPSTAFATTVIDTEGSEDRTPAPRNKFGEVVFAVDDIRPGLGLASASGGEGALVQWGVGETLFTTAIDEGSPVFGQPWLVQEWTVAPDLSKVDMTVAQGVQFHGGWGEMTAEDVVYTINDANARVTPESVHGQAGDLANIWDAWSVTGTYTLEAPMHNFDPRWKDNALSDGFQLTGVFSKKVFDDLGPDGARDTIVMTGPYEASEWIENQKAVLTKVDNHWRANPEAEQITFIAAPEPAVRAAMLRTGDADIASVASNDIPVLVKEGFKTTGTMGGAELNLTFSGNLWETEQATTGDLLERGGLDTSKPWIGDPSDPTGFERAQKVRLAMAMAIDRDAIADALTGGIGWAHYIPFFNSAMPDHKDEWQIEYDPAAARALLIEAGYPNGFDAVIFGQCCDGARQFTAEAVAGFWSQDLGLDVEVQSYGYRPEWRAGLVARTTSVPHMHACDDGRLPRPWDWPLGITYSSLSRGGFACAVESPFIAETWLKVAAESDIEKRLEMNMAVGDYLRETVIGTGVYTSPALIVFNPQSIASWQPRPSLFGPITGTELIKLVGR
jgi:ABC-type transport system substrate-binding protein